MILHYVITIGFNIGLVYRAEEGGMKCLRNLCSYLPNYTGSHPGRLQILIGKLFIYIRAEPNLFILVYDSSVIVC